MFCCHFNENKNVNDLAIFDFCYSFLAIRYLRKPLYENLSKSLYFFYFLLFLQVCAKYFIVCAQSVYSITVCYLLRCQISRRNNDHGNAIQKKYNTLHILPNAVF